MRLQIPDMCIAQSIEVFATGMVAGVFVMGCFAVHPAAAKLGASSDLAFRQQLIPRLSKFMPPLMLLPIFACVAALMFRRTCVWWPLTILSGAFSLATLAITIVVNVPLNWRFARLGPDALSYDWDRWLRRWNAAHSARTATALAAFVCAILAGD